MASDTAVQQKAKLLVDPICSSDLASFAKEEISTLQAQQDEIMSFLEKCDWPDGFEVRLRYYVPFRAHQVSLTWRRSGSKSVLGKSFMVQSTRYQAYTNILHLELKSALGEMISAAVLPA